MNEQTYKTIQYCCSCNNYQNQSYNGYCGHQKSTINIYFLYEVLNMFQNI